MTKQATTHLLGDMELGRTLKCMLCDTTWSKYEKGYEATVTGHTPEGHVKIRFDCPSCHSYLIYEVPQ